MSDPGDDNFLARWSRRKAQGKQGVQPVVPRAAEPARVLDLPARPVQTGPLPAVSQGEPAADAQPLRVPPPAPLPTLADVAELSHDSDYSRFVAPSVDVQVKNAAMKKLFTDPHFNVMDGLDVYIDDYNKFEPIPKSMLRQMVQARSLGLLDDELEEQDQPPPDNPVAHEDSDLQLQPHDAAGRPGADESIAEPDGLSDQPGQQPADDPHHPVPPPSA